LSSLSQAFEHRDFGKCRIFFRDLTIIAGKQDVPFYATNLFWDPIKMFPQGLSGTDRFRSVGRNSAGEPVNYSKEGKAPPPSARKNRGAFELALIAGQFIFYDNNEYNFDSDLKNDSYLFEEQLLARYKTDWFNHFMVNVQRLTANG
jgi:hypothetical protein